MHRVGSRRSTTNDTIDRGSLCEVGHWARMGFMVALVVGLAGCAVTERTPTDRQADAAAVRFSLLSRLADVDQDKATTALADIPDDPEAPSSAEATSKPDRSDRAVRLREEADRLFAEQRYTETVQTLEKSLRHSGDNPEAHRLMALACLLSGNTGRAQASAERTIALRPDDLIAHYVLARLAIKAKKPPEAMRHYRTALKCPEASADPTWRLLVHYYLAIQLYAEGYYSAAIEQFEAFQTGVQKLDEETIERNPELATIVRVHCGTVTVYMARAHAVLGNHLAAAEALAVVVEQSPDDIRLREAYVEALVRAGRQADARAEADRLAQDTEGDPRIIQLLLDVYCYTGQPDRGMETVKAFADAWPENVDLWLVYTDALVSAERFDEAAHTLNELIARHPEAAEARWKVIALHRLQREWTPWLVALASEVVRRPDDYERATRELKQVSDDIATALVERSEEVHSLITALALEDDHDRGVQAASDYLFGRLCDRLDQMDRARTFYQRSIDREPGFLPAVMGLAELYVHRNRWADALASMEAVVAEGDEPVAELERLAGQCHDGLDHVDEAIAHYEKAIQLRRADIQSMMSLGRLYDRIGDLRKAHRQYQAAIAADAEDLLAREALIRNRLARGPQLRLMQLRDPVRMAVLSELLDMRRVGAEDPATLRCAALCEFRLSPRRDVQKYVRRLRKIVELYPDDLRSRMDLAAVLLFQRFEYEAAWTEIVQLLEKDPYAPAHNDLMAVALMRLLRFDEAAAQFERMLDWFPNRRMWIRNFAELRMIEQDYDAAIPMWQRLMETEESDARRHAFQLQLVTCYRLAKRYDEAYQRAQGWLDDIGDDGVWRDQYRLLLLVLDESAEDTERYLRRCREWLKAEPDDLTVTGWLLTGLMNAKRYDQAMTLAVETMNRNANVSRRMSAYLLDLLFAAGERDQAIELAESEYAGVDAKDRIVGLQRLASAYARADRANDEIRTRRDIVQALPDESDPKALFEAQAVLATTLSRHGEYEKAVNLLNGTISKLASNRVKIDLLKRLSYIHQQQDRLDLAEARLREAYKLAPLDVGLNNDFGYTLADRGKDLDEAERMIRIAVGEQPHQPAYQDSLGWVLYRKGDVAQARTWLERAAGLEGGQDPVIYDHLGDIQWCLGDKDPAAGAWQKALALHAERVEQGQSEPDDPQMAKVRGKLDAVEAGQAPDIAPIVETETAAP